MQGDALSARLVFVRRQHDPINKRVDNLDRFGTSRFIGKGFMQGSHFLPVVVRHVRVNADRAFSCFC